MSQARYNTRSEETRALAQRLHVLRTALAVDGWSYLGHKIHLLWIFTFQPNNIKHPHQIIVAYWLCRPETPDLYTILSTLSEPPGQRGDWYVRYPDVEEVRSNNTLREVDTSVAES